MTCDEMRPYQTSTGICANLRAIVPKPRLEVERPADCPTSQQQNDLEFYNSAHSFGKLYSIGAGQEN